MKRKFNVRSKVALYPGMAGWHFLYIDKKQTEVINKNFGKEKRGWGSLPVAVALGKTKWETSIFPDKKSGTYLLPLKAEVRKREEIVEGDTVNFLITIR